MCLSTLKSGLLDGSGTKSGWHLGGWLVNESVKTSKTIPASKQSKVKNKKKNTRLMQ